MIMADLRQKKQGGRNIFLDAFRITQSTLHNTMHKKLPIGLSRHSCDTCVFITWVGLVKKLLYPHYVRIDKITGNTLCCM